MPNVALEHVGKPHSCCEAGISAAAPNGSDSTYLKICLVLRRGASLEILASRFRKRVSQHALFVLAVALCIIVAPALAGANHWPEPFEYMNGTAPREPEFLPCPLDAIPDAECATQRDELNRTSYRIVWKDGFIIRVVKVLLEGSVALTIYPLPPDGNNKQK